MKQSRRRKPAAMPTAEEFIQAVLKHTVAYCAARSDAELSVLEVSRNLCQSLQTGTYQRTAPMIRAACTELGVPNTRESINQIFETKPNEGADNGTN